MEDLIYGLKISAIGITVVFVALILIAWVVSLFQALDRENKPKPPSKKKEETKPTIVEEKEVSPNELPPDVIAVISAAVAVSVGKAKIKRIRYRSTPSDPSWVEHGRVTIMASHKIDR